MGRGYIPYRKLQTVTGTEVLLYRLHFIIIGVYNSGEATTEEEAPYLSPTSTLPSLVVPLLFMYMSYFYHNLTPTLSSAYGPYQGQKNVIINLY